MSQELQTSRLSLVLAGEANVSVSGGERLGIELLRLVPIPRIGLEKTSIY